MQIDQYAYFLTVTNIDRKAAEELTESLRQKSFFDGMLVPSYDEEDIKNNVVTFDCGFEGSIPRIDRDEIDLVMHTLAQTTPGATFTLFAQNTDNLQDQYQVRTYGDLYSCSRMVSYMPEMSQPVPYDERHSIQPVSLDHDYASKFLRSTDFNLLYQQKMALLHARDKDTPLQKEVIDGLVNFLDFIGDWAEKEGVFTYPQMTDPEEILDDIMDMAGEELNEIGLVLYPLPDERFFIRLETEVGSDDSMNPDKDFYSLKLIYKGNRGFCTETTGYAEYNDFAGLRECCETALKQYEVLSERRSNSLDEKIAAATARTPSGTSPQQKEPDREVT